MPFAPISKIQQEQQLNQQGQGINISGGAGANFADVVPGQQKEKSSGQYTNLKDYLNANQSQSQEMGQKINQQVDQSGAAAQQKVQDFGSQQYQAAAFNPDEYIQNAPNLSQEQKQSYQTNKATGGYTGPQSLEQAGGYADTQKAAREASNKAKLAGTESGQQELLKQAYSRPSYSAGENKLDQVLLGGNQQARQGLSDLSKKYSGLYDVFNANAENLGSQINQANEQSFANRQAFILAENKAWQDFLTPLQQRAQQENVNKAQYQTDVFNDVGDDLFSDQTLQRLGLTEGQKLYDLDLSSYLSPNLTELGVNDVAQAEERQRYKALADLFQDPTRVQIGDTGLSNTAVNFDRQKFDKDIGTRGQEAKAAYERVAAAGISPKYIEENNTLGLSYDYLRNAGIDINSDYWKNQPINDTYFGRIKLAEKIMSDYNNAFRPNRKIGRQT